MGAPKGGRGHSGGRQLGVPKGGRRQPATEVTAVSPDAAVIWRAARGPVVIALVIVTVAIGIALLTAGGEGGALHPEGVGPTGSRALARIVEAEGVRVELVDTTADAVLAARGGDVTLLVTRSGLLRPSQLDAVAEAGATDLVLVAPADEALAALAPSLHEASAVEVTEREPGCDLAAAEQAGVADLGGTGYRTTDAADRCYDDTLVRVGSGGGTVTVLGSGTPLHNRHLDEDGNAALAMGLLGRHERLVWYVPTPGDPATAGEQRPLAELVPVEWRFGAIQLAVAVVLLALWRARRLGPVVVEPLPVAVRGAETVEGLARLYRRAGARDRAADALRGAASSRIAAMVGSRPEDTAAAVAGRTGRHPDDVRRLLDGASGPSGTDVPADDAALVRLADQLDALEKEVRGT